MKPREPRQKVVLPAQLRWDRGQSDIQIRDVSPGGMMIQAPQPPERGAYVEIVRPACTVIGRVVWSKEGRFGIQSRNRICLTIVLERRRVPRPGNSVAPLVQPTPASRSRAPGAAERAEASRRVARLFEYGVLAAGAAFGAVTAGSLLYATLVGTAHAVSLGLS